MPEISSVNVDSSSELTNLTLSLAATNSSTTSTHATLSECDRSELCTPSLIGVTHAQHSCTGTETCTDAGDHKKSCGLIGRLCLEVSGTRNLH